MAERDGIIGTLLAYIDKPWKIAVIVIGGVGFAAFEAREEIISWIFHRPVVAALKVEEFNAEASVLLQETHGDVTQLFAIDLEKNLAHFVAGFDKTGAPWKVMTLPTSLVHDDTAAKLVVDLIEGTPFCIDVSDRSKLAQQRAEAAAGIRRACVVAIPPVTGVLVGALYVGWKTALASELEFGAEQTMRDAAMRMAVW